MAKKEKTVELKPKADKISEEHLKELQSIVGTINQIHLAIGKIEGQKHNLLHDLAVTNNKVAVFQETLNKEYGNDDVNVMDGTINWKKDEK
jgi:hypothetical protein|tara:strand:- start:133 stop:405 length:273 start_codon:yes stop_codon:yes gene_type:complete